MSISVLIPAYNCTKTIRATLNSVFAQTVAPDEVLVMDDGSTDDTLDILNSYRPRITVLRQPNRGVASARNALVKKATGDLLAFVDCDDLWNSRYLETQRRLFKEHPKAVAFFTWHVNFRGYGVFDWDATPVNTHAPAELIAPLEFLKRYNKTTGFFASMSYCCVPQKVFLVLDSEPFHEDLPGVDDSFLCTTLPLLGPVVFFPEALVAYRVTEGAQSRNRLKMFRMWVDVFRHLETRYKRRATPELLQAFRAAYASKRRGYAKILMGAGETQSAREQLEHSLKDCGRPASIAKSLAILFLTYIPGALQPNWPSRHKE